MRASRVKTLVWEKLPRLGSLARSVRPHGKRRATPPFTVATCDVMGPFADWNAARSAAEAPSE